VSPWTTLKVALRALLRNKMRSFLTVLGVVIGVGAVIAMVGIGEGAKARVRESFEKMGTNVVVVRSGSSRGGGVRGGAGSQPSITWDDLAAIRTELPTVALAAPQLRASSQVQAEGQNWTTGVEGTTPEYFEIRSWPVSRGEPIRQTDVDGATKVAIIGQTVATNLFGPYADPVGQTLRINNVPFEVIGVAARKGQSQGGNDFDDVVFVPATTFTTKIESGLQKYLRGSIYVSARTSTQAVQAEVEALLRARHRIRPGADDDFSVRNMEEIASAQQEGAETMTRLLAGIALVSLLVGGIGIMNIMLVSVTERTREIGLRIAVGAKARQILLQFVVEAVSLSVIGGLLGVAGGLGAARYLSARFDWPLFVQPQVIAIAVGFSAIVGVGFGLYPAYKASRLDPIQALRYE
jgi:putative ABC transport system permease protein